MAIVGESVTFTVRSSGGTDDMGNDTFSTSDVSVANVLVAQSNTSDMTGEDRPYGDFTTIDLYLPKGTSLDLRGASVVVPRLGTSKVFDVIGDPEPYPSWLTPGEFNVVVQAKLREG